MDLPKGGCLWYIWFIMAEQSLKEKTAKGLFWGGLSNGAMQVVGLVVGIILLKFLSPDDYGIVGLLTIFSGIASTIQESGFTMALVNRSGFKHEDYNAVFWFNVVVGWGLYLILFLLAPCIAAFYGKPELVSLSRFSFLSFAVASMGIAHNALLMKELKVKERSEADIIAISLSGVIAILLALKGYGYWTLVIQQFVYTSSWSLLRWRFSSWRPTFHWDMRPLKEMFSFSLKLLFSSIITQVHANIFSVLLGKFNTVANVGYFAQGTKWANMGSMLINGMVSGVAQPVFVEVQAERERLVQVFRKLLRFVSFVSFPLMLGLAFVGQEFIGMINSDWLPSVPILQMYCVAGAFAPIQVLYSQMIVSQGRSDFYFWCTILYACAQIGVACWALRYGIYWMACANMLVSFIYLGVWHLFAGRVLSICLWAVLKDIAPYLIIVSICFGCAWAALYAVDNNFLRFFGKIMISALLYVGAMWKLDSVVFKESVRFFIKK